MKQQFLIKEYMCVCCELNIYIERVLLSKWISVAFPFLILIQSRISSLLTLISSCKPFILLFPFFFFKKKHSSQSLSILVSYHISVHRSIDVQNHSSFTNKKQNISDGWMIKKMLHCKNVNAIPMIK